MSTTRAISASRQRTGSRSPRRAWVVRFTPTRSSTSPESNSPSNGSLIQVRRPPGIAGTSHKSQDRTRRPPRLPWRGIPRTGRDASVSPGRAAGRRSVSQHGGDPQDRDDRLDDGVLHGDRVTARATSAVQQQPRDHRHIVPPRDPAPAAGAGRRRVKQRALLLVLFGEPQDTDVEKAPETEPQESGADEQDRISDHASPRRAGYPPRPRR